MFMKDQLKEALVAVKNGEDVRARVIVAGLLKEQPDNVAGWVLLSKLAENEVQKTAFLHKVIALDPYNEYAAAELSQLEGKEEVVEPTEPVLAEVEAEGNGLATAPPVSPGKTTVEEAPEGEVNLRTGEAGLAAPTTELPARELEIEGVEETEEVETPPTPPPFSEEPVNDDVQEEAEALPPWLADEESAEASTATAAVSIEETAPPADLPDWLQEEPEEEWAGDGEGEMIAESAPVPKERVTQRPEVTRIEKPAVVATKGESSVSWVAISLGILLILIFLALIYAVLTLL